VRPDFLGADSAPRFFERGKMSHQPLFAGLVFDENDRPAGTAVVGGEPCYVVDDNGFRIHIPAEKVDRQVLKNILEQIQGNEGMISQQAAKMMGQEDIFTKAMIENQLKNIDKQLDLLLETGIPENMRMYMGMTGFKVVINYHGDLVRLDQPSAPEGDEGGEGGE
jgi:hypothetical protein